MNSTQGWWNLQLEPHIAPIFQAIFTKSLTQGSVTDSIPFLVYINDLPDGLESKTRLFTDDTIVCMTVANDSDVEALQDDLKQTCQVGG